jgi:flagellar hook-associated protein 3 FlgL
MASEQSARATEVVSTGVAVTRPWESPLVGRVVTEQIASAGALAMSDAAGRRLDEVDAMDIALGQVTDALTNANTLAVQLANGVYTAGDRLAAAGSVRQFLAEVVGAMNTDVGGRFLFAGTASPVVDGNKVPPFQSNGTYLGDDGVLQQEVAPGVLQPVSVRADVAIKGVGGGVDVTAVLTAFAAALETNDLAGIQQTITDLGIGIPQVAASRSQVGGMQGVLQFAIDTGNQIGDAADRRRADITDADVVAAATDLALTERALDAALTVSAKSFALTLLQRV